MRLTHTRCSPNSIHHLQGGLTVGYMHIIHSNSKINKGPVTTFRGTKEILGGYKNVGASKVDFKNFSRDLKSFISSSDAQMLIDIPNKRKEACPTFQFDYDKDDDGCLSRVFWADGVCQKNCKLFGDAMSFDTTFRTNKYMMVFCPFTGIDNHTKCVTFGAGLLAKEDIPSFKWLFNTFLTIIGKSQPNYIITDQDPAMKEAAEDVFNLSTHRFCAWHIMKKLSGKVPHNVYHGTNFSDKLNGCVWDKDLEPEEFEKEWKDVIKEFELDTNEWLAHMFEKRATWVPAFFRDIKMGGVLLTTSRSESENNFFNQFTNHFLSLVELWARFESAMDAQRHSQSLLNKESNNSLPELKTDLQLEKHASEVYTLSMFYHVQEEIYASIYYCSIEELKKENEIEEIVLRDKRKDKTCIIKYKPETQEGNCSCKLFERKGFICRHMFWVLKEKCLKEIPIHYILNRWTKKATKQPLFDLEGNILEDTIVVDEKKKLLGEQWSEFISCVDLAYGEKENMEELVKHLQAFEKEKMNERNNQGKRDKRLILECFVRTGVPEEISVKNPKQSKNKGSGTRLKSTRDVLKEKSMRQCRACGEYACLSRQPQL